jgi:hypothetical protein
VAAAAGAAATCRRLPANLGGYLTKVEANEVRAPISIGVAVDALSLLGAD